MKKILSLLLVALLVLSFSTVAFAEETASIQGQVNVPFAFDNDGKVILKQGESAVKIVNIQADGSYLLSGIPAGDYDLVVSVPGWTEFKVTDINVYAGDEIEIYYNTVIAGDVDNSGVIDITDVAVAVNEIGNGVTDENIGSDVDHSKDVSIADLSVVLAAENYGQEAYSISYMNNGWSNTY